MSSSSSIPYCSSFCLVTVSTSSIIAVTSALSCPVLMSSLSARKPKARPIEPIKMDFPAPVSPLKIFSPWANSISKLSMSAMFFTCKLDNIITLLNFPLSPLSLYHHISESLCNLFHFILRLDGNKYSIISRNRPQNPL